MKSKMANAESIITYILFFIGVIITLIIPIPLEEEYRLFAITTVIFTFLTIILSKFDKNLKDINEKFDEINKRFKTIEELNDIRLDIRELKREVFKIGQKR